MRWVKIAGAQNGARGSGCWPGRCRVLPWGDLNSASVNVASKVGAVKYCACLSWLPEGFAPGWGVRRCSARVGFAAVGRRNGPVGSLCGPRCRPTPRFIFPAPPTRSPHMHVISCSWNVCSFLCKPTFMQTPQVLPEVLGGLGVPEAHPRTLGLDSLL